MKRSILLGIFLLVVLMLSACNANVIETPQPVDVLFGGDMTDTKRLMNSLSSTGATVESIGDVQQDFFSVQGQLIRLLGGEVQVYEYPDEASAQAEAQLISADGSSVGTHMMMWLDTPHFFHQGTLIVLYLGGDENVLGMLEALLGPQLAGG